MEFEQGGMSLAEQVDEYANQVIDGISSDIEYRGGTVTWLDRRQALHDAFEEVLAQYPVYNLQEGEFITTGEGNDYFAQNGVDYDHNDDETDRYQERLIAAGWSPSVDYVRHGIDDAWVYWICKPANPNSEEDGVDEFVYITREFKTTEELNEWLLMQGR